MAAPHGALLTMFSDRFQRTIPRQPGRLNNMDDLKRLIDSMTPVFAMLIPTLG